MTLTPALFRSNKADGTDPSKLRPSDWNRVTDLINALLNAADATGSILLHDATDVTKGAAWLPDVAVGSVLVAGGVGAAPAWSASPTLAIGATGNARFLQATVSDHGAVGHFNFCVGQSTNPGDANRADHVLTVGYNTTGGGGRSNASEPAFEWRIEDYYAPGGGAPGPYVEAHWQYYDALGAGFRPIACQIDRTNGGYLANATLSITATGFSYLGIDGTQYVKFSQAQVQLLNNATLDVATNNVVGIRQAKASGSLRNLIYMNASDQITIGSISGDNLDIKWMKPLVALGGGAAPTLGTIGGSGPATAAQNTWMRVIDSTGAAFYVPAWK